MIRAVRLFCGFVDFRESFTFLQIAVDGDFRASRGARENKNRTTLRRLNRNNGQFKVKQDLRAPDGVCGEVKELGMSKLIWFRTISPSGAPFIIILYFKG